MRTCEEIRDALSRFVDGDLPAEARATIRGHLGGCAACRGLVADLERLRSSARELGPIEPPDHLWLEVAGQIRLEDVRAQPAVPRRVRPAAPWQWAGLAAALVLITLGAYLFRGSVPSPEQPAAPAVAGNAPRSGSVETVTEELTLALQHYENAIAELETIARNGDGEIDPAIAATVRRNLGAIDQAIVESRTALGDDPSSVPARDSLFEALRRKVTVLQTTVALINQMRQGDPAGAARITSGGKKS